MHFECKIMSQYEEYRPKKPRNLTWIIIGAFVSFALIVLIILYILLVSSKDDPSIRYPEKIIMPAGQEQSFQMEENIQSDMFIVTDSEITAIEDMLFGDYEDVIEVEPEPVTETPPQMSEKTNQQKYTPIFVASPDSPKWITNAVPSNIDPEKPMVAIVIDDLGIDKKRTRETIELPAPLNLAFLPYPTQLPEQTKAAKEAGHELIMHMPMEPSNLEENNPGPNALLTRNSKDKNLQNLTNSLDQFDGYVGINNHMGSRFTANYDAMGPILEEVKRRGLLFFDSRTVGSSKAEKLANELDLPFVSRDVFLDHDPSRAGVEASLAKTARIARQKGTAVAIGHPKDNTIAALKAWIPQAKAQGIQIVPLTTIAYTRMGMAIETSHTDEVLSYKPQTIKELTAAHIAKEILEDTPTEDMPEAVTVTIGSEDSYDAIIWNEPETDPVTY